MKDEEFEAREWMTQEQIDLLQQIKEEVQALLLKVLNKDESIEQQVEVVEEVLFNFVKGKAEQFIQEENEFGLYWAMLVGQDYGWIEIPSMEQIND